MDLNKAGKASKLFAELSWSNLNEQNKRCPKSCKLLKSYISGTTVKPYKSGEGWITIFYQRLIKVSRSRMSYGTLELMAEVGGYFGLFLGVSINQMSTVLKKLFDLAKKFTK